MRIAIPVTDGRLAEHFGHCEQFLFVDADMSQRKVLEKKLVSAPEHVPGLLPRWLGENGVEVVIAGGLGARARGLLSAAAVQLITGVTAAEPDLLIESFLNGKLEGGENRCDHAAGHNCEH